MQTSAINVAASATPVFNGDQANIGCILGFADLCELCSCTRAVLYILREQTSSDILSEDGRTYRIALIFCANLNFRDFRENLQSFAKSFQQTLTAWS